MRKSREKYRVGLVALITAVQHQVHVTPGLSSNAFERLPPTVPMEDGISDTAVRASHTSLIENAKTEFSTLSDAIKALCHVYHKDFFANE